MGYMPSPATRGWLRGTKLLWLDWGSTIIATPLSLPNHSPTICDAVMTSTCCYCGCSFEDGVSKCESCGAPIATGGTSTSDFRSCPYCRRRLLALASPSCSYCGRRLPEHYIKAREADLKRIADIRSGDSETDANQKLGELIRHNALQNNDESFLDVLKIKDLTDLLS